MNATMTAPSRQIHPPPARRVGLLDRLALRLGLALIVWGRRPVRARHERYITHDELVELRRLETARDLARPFRPYL